MNFFAGTDTGKVRKENEDHIFASGSPVGPLQNLFLVADGMGGYQGGEYASRYVVEHLVREIQNSQKTNPVSILNDAIQEANRGRYWLWPCWLEESGCWERGIPCYPMILWWLKPTG